MIHAYNVLNGVIIGQAGDRATAQAQAWTALGLIVVVRVPKLKRIDFWHYPGGILTEKSQAEKTAILDAEAVIAQAEINAQETVQEARAEMQNLPGWSSWTAEQADDWVTANIGDLTTASHRAALITAIRNMARAIIYLRDHSRITN